MADASIPRSVLSPEDQYLVDHDQDNGRPWWPVVVTAELAMCVEKKLVEETEVPGWYRLTRVGKIRSRALQGRDPWIGRLRP